MTGEEIRKARLKKGLSQQKLAEMIGASLQSVFNWEKGKTKHQELFEERLRQALK